MSLRRIKRGKVAVLLAALLAMPATLHAATFTRLASFNGLNGAYPQAGVILDPAGNLYGTTAGTGTTGNVYGNIFRLNVGSSTPISAANFNSTNGASPGSALIADSAGNLYGTTTFGGASNNGTVFRYDVGASAPTVLASFTGGTGGARPNAGVVFDSFGSLYGTTVGAGSNNDGTIFRVDVGNSVPTTLSTFNDLSAYATGGVIADAAGNLYGAATQGGPNSKGSIYRLNAGSSAVTNLASFNGTNGSRPVSGLIRDAAGNLYGTTNTGGVGEFGTIFRLNNGGVAPTILATFGGGNGAHPDGALLLDAAGNLFGTTYDGGTNNSGTVFRLDAGSSTPTTLFNFVATDGLNPRGALTVDAFGNLYGTTVNGGADGFGTVFRISNAGFVPEPACLTSVAVASITVLRRRRTDRA